MSEILVSRVPDPELLDETFRGMSFADFAALDDDEVRQLHHELWGSAPGSRGDEDWIPIDQDGRPDDSFSEAMHQAAVFSRFAEWRRFGIPDRNVTYAELLDWTADTVRLKRAENQDFGHLTPGQYQELSTRQRIATKFLLEYLLDQRDPFEQPVVDAYSLTATLGFEDDDVKAMEDMGILEPLEDAPSVGVVYLLGQPYADYLLNRNFPAQH